MQLAYHRPFLLTCMYQTREVGGHVYFPWGWGMISLFHKYDDCIVHYVPFLLFLIILFKEYFQFYNRLYDIT